MSAPSFDPVQYRTQQREGWDKVADAWKQWWAVFESGGQTASDRLVELARIQGGERVLDVGTGIGEPAVTAARRVGARGRVIATDLSTQMLAIARGRAADLKLENVQFRIMDAEAPDLPERSFDAILCRWALMLFPEPETTLSALRHLLVPGGSLAVAVWGEAAKVPIISLRIQAMVGVLGLAPPPAGTPGPFRLADPRDLESMFTRTGFTGVRSERLTAVFDFDSVETFTRFQREVGGPRVPTLADQTAERQAEFWQAVADGVRPYADATGRVQLPNEMICAVGRR
jgi:ubiquinone/menaquinone biosynthesis C-methylase UbiE